jgi:hypothetical protein
MMRHDDHHHSSRDDKGDQHQTALAFEHQTINQKTLLTDRVTYSQQHERPSSHKYANYIRTFLFTHHLYRMLTGGLLLASLIITIAVLIYAEYRALTR